MVPPLDTPSESLMRSTAVIVFCFSQTQRPFFTIIPSAHHPGNSEVHCSASLFLVNLHSSLNTSLELLVGVLPPLLTWPWPYSWPPLSLHKKHEKNDLGDLNINVSDYMSKKRGEDESKACKSCFLFLFFLGKLPVNCSFVVIDRFLDSFAWGNLTGTTTWAGKPLFTGALSDITPWSRP